MLSSRRLAREWALKILYQIDVGKPEPTEALEAALETLRREFVQRGSRTPSGSVAEERTLEYVTASLRDTLPTLRLPLERALAAGSARLLEEAPYWQELRLERAFRSHAPGLTLQPPRLLTPLPNSALIPPTLNPADGLSVHVAALTPEERERYRAFVRQAREELPRLLDAEGRTQARVFARDLAANRPFGATPDQVQSYLRKRREEFNGVEGERWRKVGAVVQKQTGDWLRTAAFVIKLVNGALTRRAAIDEAISALSSGWRLERQVAVDRNILRLAGYEMLFLPGIPAGATINEAVELAKKFSTAESGRFVNGVLGALAAQVGDKLTPPAAAQDAIETDERDEPIDIPELTDMEESDSV